MATKRSTKEIAAELEEIGGALSGSYGRRVLRVAAELSGEELPPTENEVREAARAEEAAKAAKEDNGS